MKKIMILLLSVLGIIAVAVAFDKAAENNEVKKENNTLTTMWFDLDVSTASNPNNPSDSEAEIVGEGSSTPTCQPTNTLEVCGIELDVTDVLSEDPGYDFEGKTVAQVIADGGKHIEDANNNPKSYSRRP